MKSELNKKVSEGSITYVEEENASPFEDEVVFYASTCVSGSREYQRHLDRML